VLALFVLVAPEPIAMDWSPLAIVAETVPSPMAIAWAPLDRAAKSVEPSPPPRAIEPRFVAPVLSPAENVKLPDAVLFCPSAIELLPLAVAAMPPGSLIAIETAPVALPLPTPRPRDCVEHSAVTAVPSRRRSAIRPRALFH